MSLADLTTQPYPFHMARPGWRLIDAAGNDWSWAYVVHREVPGIPGYCVGSDGCVWSKRRRQDWRRLNPVPRSIDNPYHVVTLRRDDGKPRYFSVHRLILSVFIGPRPPEIQACHFPDRDTSNNRLSNLRWGTSRDNRSDSRDHGTLPMGTKVGTSKLGDDEVCEIRRLAAQGVFIRDIIKVFPVGETEVNRIVLGQAWKHIPAESEDGHAARRYKVQVRGNRQHAAKLTEAEVAEMRRLGAMGESQRSLARRFGVSRGLVWRILRRHYWQHVPPEPAE